MTTGLTREQVKAVADRLDNVVGNNFHHSVVSALHEVGWAGFDDSEGISDGDVYKIKMELALGYLQEYKDYYDKKHSE